MIYHPKELYEALKRRPPQSRIIVCPVVVDKKGEYICTSIHTCNFEVVVSIDVNENNCYIRETADSLVAALDRCRFGGSYDEKYWDKGRILLAYCAVNGAVKHVHVNATLNRGKLKLVKAKEVISEDSEGAEA